ncbi:GPR1/FUN34/yaaH family protein [Methanosarcina siciliae C2J]|uniref:GPR1/FUN34/yaaH family protein n=3 Tax=Methanosarcina siciliae TaxID=38027 RepID=A0A0E3PHM4_9EURY|nr:acetate uptake transporter family protein [Methanosarcina siciliae]AKB30384.1 GPR1/FUN34/yaaH family protein [Methanosarcina siciliae T4/M]AKB34302.1 GPR1/FUN34/yaaH family protein [Methanosarcina siciliae HI350]AKB38666.1 GPR1/FUN34/yaaH family protein [Methanosarcina siciliae C2J]
MSENAASTVIVDKTANAAPLGFTGLGLAAVLLSLSYIGVYPVGSMIVSMAIFLGGFAQVFAGIMSWKKGDIFAGTAFSAFGLFWFSLAGLIVMPAMGWIEASSGLAMAAYLFIWGVYTFVMLIITIKIGVKALQFVFVTLFILFMLLAVVNATGSAGLLVVAGYVGLIMGLASMYTALAMVMNEVHGKTVAPL